MAAASTEARSPAATAPSHPRHSLPSLLVVVLVGCLSAWHASEASEHLLTDRDPGVYNTTARWLAREGTLLVDPAVGPFADHASLSFEEQGWNLDEDGRLEPQFLHLLPVVLAAARWLGGDGLLLAAPAFVAGAALLAHAAFARRLLRPWWALLATAGLATSLPWVHLSRDAFSEPLAALLLFGGLTLLWDATSTAGRARAACAGLLLGAVSMARVEGFVILLPLVATGFVHLVRGRRRPGEGGAAWRVVAAAGAGVAGTAGLAVADLLVYGTWYLGDLSGLLVLVGAGLVAVVLAGTVALASAGRRRGGPSDQPARPYDREVGEAGERRAARRGTVAAGIVVLTAAAAWLVRPATTTVTGAPSPVIATLEAAEGRVAEGVRRYSEHSVQWLGWYLGPIALALGIAGLALVVRRLVARPAQDLRLLPFVAVLVTVSGLYLWRPSIVPDHVWVMRRYATVTIPGLVLLSALAGQALADRWRRRGWTALVPLTALAVAAAVVGFPVATVVPVAGASTQEGMLDGVEDVCRAVGPSGAVVVVPGGALELVAGQALRSFCGVPVAIARPELSAAQVGDLASAWAADGRALHLVGADAARVGSLGGRQPEVEVAVTNDQQLEATLTQRPDEVVSVPVSLVVAEVAPGRPGSGPG